MRFHRKKAVDVPALKTSLFVVFLLVIILGVFDPGKITGYLTKDNQAIIFVELDIPREYERPHPGDTILVETSILQRGGELIESGTPVDLEYTVTDLQGGVIAKKQARGSIATKLSDVVSLLIPSTTQPGVYVAAVKVTMPDGASAVGSKTFEILGRSKRTFVSIGRYSLLILALLFSITFLFYRFFTRSRTRKKMTI